MQLLHYYLCSVPVGVWLMYFICLFTSTLLMPSQEKNSDKEIFIYISISAACGIILIILLLCIDQRRQILWNQWLWEERTGTECIQQVNGESKWQLILLFDVVHASGSGGQNSFISTRVAEKLVEGLMKTSV